MSLPEWVKSNPDYFERDMYRDLIRDHFTQTVEEMRKSGKITDQTAQVWFEAGDNPVALRDSSDPQLKRLYAKSAHKAIFSAIFMNQKSERFIMYALNRAREEGWWRWLGEEEYDSVEEFVRDIYEKAVEANPQGSTAYDYGYILNEVIPLFRGAGIPADDAIQMMADKKSKFRQSIPALRRATANAKTEEEKYEAIIPIVHDILDENMNVRQLRDKYGRTAEGRPKISAAGSAYYMMTAEGAGYIVMEVRDRREATTIEMAVRGLTDNPEGFAFPRDGVLGMVAMLERMAHNRDNDPRYIKAPLMPREIVDRMHGGQLDVVMNVPKSVVMEGAGEIRWFANDRTFLDYSVGEKFELIESRIVGLGPNEALQMRFVFQALIPQSEIEQHYL